VFEIGSSLREERHRRHLGLAEVESATHIRVRNLQAIEDEDFDMLPPGMYRRSFLREYAEFLGLDGDAYAAEYELRCARGTATRRSPRRAARRRRCLSARPAATAGCR
jgi:cytoskeletal protein RodZ